MRKPKKIHYKGSKKNETLCGKTVEFQYIVGNVFNKVTCDKCKAIRKK